MRTHFLSYKKECPALRVNDLRSKLIDLLIAFAITGMVFLALSFTASAQSPASGSIKGKIADKKSAKAIEFATVALYQMPDSVLVTGTKTDLNGAYELKNLKPGNYLIKINYLGYQSQRIDNINLTKDKMNLELPALVLEEKSQMLNEVKVEAERLKGTTEADKTVYSVSDKIAATAHSGIDLLKQVPAVQVDFQNNISLEGQSNILIYVDGRQKDKEYLAQLDPKSIDKIEISTNPSVKYDADISGVITIILKKERRGGFSGRFEGEVPISTDKVFSNSSANLEYGYNKIRVFANSYMHLEEFVVRNEKTSQDYLKPTEPESHQMGKGKMRWLNFSVDYGLDWFIDDKNIVNFYGNLRPRNGGKFDFDLTPISGPSVVQKSSILNDNNINSQYYSLFYKHTFATNHEITFDLNYFNHKGTTLTTTKRLPEGVVYYDETREEKKQNMGFKADYSRKISDLLSMNAGYQTYNQWMDYYTIFASDANKLNNDYFEGRHAGYVNLSGKIKTFNWQAGVRYEYSAIQIDENSTSNYDCFLPQFSIKTNLGKIHSLRLNLRRSIFRPGLGDLNPQVTKQDDQNISMGNPALKPSYGNKAELTYSVKLGSSFINLGTYYNYFTDNILRAKRFNGDMIESYIDNIGTGYEAGTNLSGSVSLAKWWQINPYVGVFYYHIDKNKAAGISNRGKLAMRANFFSNIELPKKFFFTTYVQYSSEYLRGSSLTSRSPIYFFGIEKEIGNLKIGFTSLNPFMDKFTVSKSVTETDYIKSMEDMNVEIGGLFTFKVTYRFNNGKKINKLERQKEVENIGNSIM
jgi:hypothetical protein